MNFALTDEQEMLREAAAGTLARHDTVAAARAALDGATLPDLWPAAREAGWPGLLIDESAGGAGLDAFEAMLVVEQCGRRLAWAGLLGHLCASRLARGGSAGTAALATRLAAGEARAACLLARPGSEDRAWSTETGVPDARASAPPAIEARGGATSVSGRVAFVPDAPGAELLVVVGQGADGIDAVAVEADAPGVTVEPMTRYDASRPLAHVTLDVVPAIPLEAGEAGCRAAWSLAQSLLAAEALGASEAMLELTVAYAKERQTFGRVIGSYQAVKHQLVEILRQAENVRSLTYYAGWAANDRPDEFGLAAASARYAAERAIDYASRTAIAIHGGIGATWEHDAPLYFRRAQLSRRLLGGLDGAGDEVAGEIIALSEREAAESVAA